MQKIAKISPAACLFLFGFFLILTLIPDMVSAQLELQLKYPKIGGVDLNNLARSGRIDLGEIGRWLYVLFVSVGGIVAFAGLIMGGFKWILYGGTIPATQAVPPQMSEAKKQVIASFLGLMVLLGSWVILNTIDPNFLQVNITLPGQNVSTIVGNLPSKEKPLEDGFIIKVAGPKLSFNSIAAPNAALRVQDTRRFPVGTATYDLSGQKDGGGKLISDGELESVSFAVPKNPTTGKHLYEYLVFCFDRPNFQGRVKIATSWSAPPSGESLKFDNVPSPFFRWEPKPCLSLMSARMPPVSNYSITDSVTFYEFPFPQREEVIIPSSSGSVIPDFDKKRIIGGCIKIGQRADIECDTNNDFPLARIALGGTSIIAQPEGCNGKTQKDKKDCLGLMGVTYVRDLGGNIIEERRWYPRSMEVKVDRAGKYLVVLYPNIYDKDAQYFNFSYLLEGRAGTGGAAYVFQTDVNNFKSTEDPRLYWLNMPGPLENNLYYGGFGGIPGFSRLDVNFGPNGQIAPDSIFLPKTALIIPVDEVY